MAALREAASSSYSWYCLGPRGQHALLNVYSYQRTTAERGSGVLSGCNPTVDIAIVLDTSNSVTQRNFRTMLEFTRWIIFHSDMDSGKQRISVVTSGSDVRVAFNLKEHSSRTTAYWAIDKVRYRAGNTGMAEALRTLHRDVFSFTHGDRPEASNIAIIITDGEPTMFTRRTLAAARRLRYAGTHIYVIGVGVSNKRQLAAMATSPAAQNVISLTNFSQLSEPLRKKLTFCNKNAVTGSRSCITPPKLSIITWVPWDVDDWVIMGLGRSL